MASLALLVTLIFLLIILAGPFAYFSSYFLPKWLSTVVCIATIILGLWWMLLPIGGARFFGVITILFAIKKL